MMVPTEVLAEQQTRALGPLAARAGLALAALTGATPAGERAAILEACARGRVQLLVGTQALLGVAGELPRLGLVIVDEQHRFGVAQRGALGLPRASGGTPHLLSMSATPIPRSLALALHGDLDASFLTERPAGRRPAATVVCAGGDERSAAYARLRDALAAGEQAFVVCPVREEARRPGAVTAIAQQARLARELAPARVGLLHGALGAAAKEEALRAFADGRTDVLVATTVVELGIDVPNATVMIVEEADRLGLAQLHQLRGRVGRGARPGICFLLASDGLPAGRARRGLGSRSARRSTTGFVWPRPISRSGDSAICGGRRRRGRGRGKATRPPRLGVAGLAELAELTAVARRRGRGAAGGRSDAGRSGARGAGPRGARAHGDAVRGRGGMTAPDARDGARRRPAARPASPGSRAASSGGRWPGRSMPSCRSSAGSAGSPPARRFACSRSTSACRLRRPARRRGRRARRRCRAPHLASRRGRPACSRRCSRRRSSSTTPSRCSRATARRRCPGTRPSRSRSRPRGPPRRLCLRAALCARTASACEGRLRRSSVARRPSASSATACCCRVSTAGSTRRSRRRRCSASSWRSVSWRAVGRRWRVGLLVAGATAAVAAVGGRAARQPGPPLRRLRTDGAGVAGAARSSAAPRRRGRRAARAPPRPGLPPLPEGPRRPAGRRPASSPSMPCGSITSALTATPATRPPTSTSWRRAAPGSRASTRRRRTPRSRWRRC